MDKFVGGQGLSMPRIVVSLLKGGVAKSETSVHLAHGLARAGYRVLLVDTDVQAQCSDMLGEYPSTGLAQVIAGQCEPVDALAEVRDNLWLLAGGVDLAGVKMEIARREIAPEAVLSDTLSRYEGGFDIMIMDTAPGWDTLLVNALYCSREVLSPVSMEPMALKGLIRFEERLRVIQRYNTDLHLKWIVPTFVDGRVKKTLDIMEQLQERYGDMLTEPVKYSVKLSEATAYGKTIFEHDPRGVGAKGYQKLVDRVIADCLSKAGVPAQAPAEQAGAAGPAEIIAAPMPQPPAKPEIVPGRPVAPAAAEGGADTRLQTASSPVSSISRPEPPAPEPAVDSPLPQPEPPAPAQSRVVSLKERLAKTVEQPEPASSRDLTVDAGDAPSSPAPFIKGLIRHGLKERLGGKGPDAAQLEDMALRRLRERLKDGRA